MRSSAAETINVAKKAAGALAESPRNIETKTDEVLSDSNDVAKADEAFAHSNLASKAEESLKVTMKAPTDDDIEVSVDLTSTGKFRNTKRS